MPGIKPLHIAQSCADSALKKMRFLESVLTHGKNNSEIQDPDGLWALAQFIYDAAKDVEAVLFQIDKELEDPDNKPDLKTMTVNLRQQLKN